MHHMFASTVGLRWSICVSMASVARRAIYDISDMSAVNEIIKKSLGAAKIPAQLEPSAISRSYSKHPVRLGPASHLGRILVWDATCLDTFVPY